MSLCIFTFLVGLISFALFFYKQINKPDPNKLFGVYSQPGKCFFFKYCMFCILLILRRLKFYVFDKSFFYKESHLEKLQVLSNHKLAVDAVFFHGVNHDGIFFCTGTERRQEGKVSGLFYLVVPEYGLLLSEKLPDTILDADPTSLYSLKEYAAEGISLTPVVPMKQWKVCFNGQMRFKNDPNKMVNVNLKADFKSSHPWFLFEVDIPIKSLSKSIAREPWSWKYFKMLKEAHQSHYEQFGEIHGTLKIDNKVIPLNMDACRDHSFAKKRDWSLMHRYIYHMLYLSNKTCISVSVICQPSTSSILELGYVQQSDGSIDTVDSVDLKLYNHGENGVLEKELWFSFSAGGITYDAKVKYEYDDYHYKGFDREARLYERFFSCEVNGVSGKGIAEWHYNNKKIKFE